MLKFESMNEWMALVDQTPDLKVDDIYSNYTFQPSTPLLPPPSRVIVQQEKKGSTGLSHLSPHSRAGNPLPVCL